MSEPTRPGTICQNVYGAFFFLRSDGFWSKCGSPEHQMDMGGKYLWSSLVHEGEEFGIIYDPRMEDK